MAFTIQLQTTGQSYQCKAYETLLESANLAGHNLPFGCQNGTCGKCKGAIISGEVDYGEHTDAALSENDIANGQALFCCALPLSDLTIAPRQPEAEMPATKILPVRVEQKKQLTNDVVVLQLKLPSKEHLTFKAGQYIEFLLKNGKRRAFSIANGPASNQLLELHLKRTTNGEFTPYVFDEMPEKTILRIEGALGDFYLREDNNKPVLMLATGTGFAPIKAMLEHIVANNIPREVHLYWGARTRADLYQYQLAEDWANAHANIHFTPVLSQPNEGDAWQGFEGYIQDAVVQDLTKGTLANQSLANFDVYCCGVAEMIAAAEKTLLKNGLNSAAFYTDIFSLADS